MEEEKKKVYSDKRTTTPRRGEAGVLKEHRISETLIHDLFERAQHLDWVDLSSSH